MVDDNGGGVRECRLLFQEKAEAVGSEDRGRHEVCGALVPVGVKIANTPGCWLC